MAEVEPNQAPGNEGTGAELPGGPRAAGPYRLLRSLGRGGFGEVFLGEGPDGRRAAVKLLHASWTADPEMRRRFATELEQARKVSGFCVAPILNADPDAAQPWIAAEYIDGRTLSDAVAADGPRSGDDLHRLAVAVATALAAIHAAGVVHRDLKPDNIMLAADGPRVIDFGIARGLEATSVTASGVVGTVGYMAPEQLEGARLGTPVDIFAWGASIVFAATGREAFPGPTQAARITRVLTGEPDTGNLAEPLLSAIRSALAKDPAQRPDAQALLARLLAPPDTASGGAGGPGATAVLPSEGASGGAEGTAVIGTDPTRVEQHDPTRVYTAMAPGPEEQEEEEEAAAHHAPAAPAYFPAEAPETFGTLVRPLPGTVPPYHFNGVRFTDPRELAAALQRDWPSAVRLFGDSEELAALGAWLIDDLGDTSVDRSIFRRRPEDIHLAIAWFIVQLNPRLPPVFRGHDASVPGLARMFSDPRPVLTGDRAAGELLLLARPQVLRTLAMHEGQEELRAVTDQLALAEGEAQAFLARLSGELAGWRQVRKAADTALMFTFVLHPELIAKPQFADPNAAEWTGILWRAVDPEGGAQAAGRAAAIYAAADTIAEAGNQKRQWELRLHDGKRELEEAQGTVWLWRWLHPVKIIALIAGVALGPVGCLFYLESGSGGSALSMVLGFALLVASFIIGQLDKPKDGFRNTRHAAQAKVRYLTQQLPQLESGVHAIQRDLATACRICEG